MTKTALRSLVITCLISLRAAFGAEKSDDASAQPEKKPALNVEVDPKYPTIGQEAVIRVSAEHATLDGVSIEVTYRPNSSVASSVKLNVPESWSGQSEGALVWQPTAEGIVTVKATKKVKDKTTGKEQELSATGTCAVRFDGFPVLGIVMLTVAFIVLFGGLTYAFIRGS